MEEPGGLQSMGLLRVRHDWATSLSLFTFLQWRRQWQPTPVFLPGESQGRGSLVGCRLWGRTESDTTEVTAAAADNAKGRICPGFLPRICLNHVFFLSPTCSPSWASTPVLLATLVWLYWTCFLLIFSLDFCVTTHLTFSWLLVEMFR